MRTKHVDLAVHVCSMLMPLQDTDDPVLAHLSCQEGIGVCFQKERLVWFCLFCAGIILVLALADQ